MTTIKMLCTLARITSMIGLAVVAVLSSGCGGSDAAAIEALTALNDKLVAEGGEKAVRMQNNGDKVGTIYIMSHIDDVLPHVAKLHNVEEIYFHDGGFGDEHVKFVNRLGSLNSLVISGTQITDKGVEQLSSMKLQALFLDGTAITSAALKPISKMTTLTSLDLTGTKVYDDLQPLQKLSNLKWLLLRDMDLSQLSEESIEALIAIPNLARFTATNTNLSDDVIKRLKKAKPALDLETGAATEQPQDLPIGGEAAAEESEEIDPGGS